MITDVGCVFIRIIVILVIVLILYDPYEDLGTKGNRTIKYEPFDIKNKKHNFILYGLSTKFMDYHFIWTIRFKTTIIRKFCSLLNYFNDFCYDTNKWKVYKIYPKDDSYLLQEITIFTDSSIVFDDMGDYMMSEVDSLKSKRRYSNIIIMFTGHTNRYKYENQQRIFVWFMLHLIVNSNPGLTP